ncbi:restriction endonuclease, SacI family [Pseudoalteromonas xiamenensis]|uniref:Restriction endonuclease, SacI family n=1 Tax=Pseudoalteromonas xiamenensis TaxID=882626 RepID=A0A975DEY8_9GAMM|nr:restriction endonuclease, SacI family [Pseudoalteromonas xiamenensis]QTH70591.1 restriction endonuclease, SacI family [Pseudoalteromonas xiamenensis]
MSINVNNDLAFEKALKAAKESKALSSPKSKWADDIKKIILGSHLTYRYILVTGLLAKSTDERVNPLCLQAKADDAGAYDARSVCHDVIVGRGIERDHLEGKLGASNEPFLNKPARFEMHSSGNAVRKGNDKLLQTISIEILSNAKDSSDAYDMLVDAFYFTLQRPARAIPVSQNKTFDFNSFVDNVLQLSSEGEVCATLVSSVFLLRFPSKGWKVKAHPVNQAGSSSKEVLDIDVYQEDKPIIAIEVKDKAFCVADVTHAVQKAQQAGVATVLFAKGPQATITDGDESSISSKASETGCKLIFADVKDIVKTSYILCGYPPVERITELINTTLASIRAKDATVQHFSDLLTKP